MKTLRYFFLLKQKKAEGLIQKYKNIHSQHHFSNISNNRIKTKQRLIINYSYSSSSVKSSGTSKMTSTTIKASTVEMVEQMRHRFRQDKDIHQEKTWESLWNDGMTPWDLGMPTPALVSELANHWKRRRSDNDDEKIIAHDSNTTTTTGNNDNRRRILRTLVPGCGAGYDLITLARHHDNLIAAGTVQQASVVGLDLSETSLHKAAEHIENALIEFCPFDRPTRIDLIKGDYFDCNKKWKVLYSFGGGVGSCGDDAKNDDCITSSLNRSEEASFDFIFDYTFFCALPPSRRKEWGQRTSQLLVPEMGRLLTFIFPILKQDDCNDDDTESDSSTSRLLPTKGPPFPVTVKDYRQALEPVGVQMESDHAYENSDTVPHRIGTELVCWWTMTNVKRRNMAKL